VGNATWIDEFPSLPDLLFIVLQKFLQTIRARSAPLMIGATSLAVLGLLASMGHWGWLEPLELLVYDRLVQLRPERPSQARLLLVAITEEDLQTYGWPVADRDLALALAHLQQAQPRMIGLDIYRDLPQEPGHAELVAQLEAPNLVAIEEVSGGIQPPPTVPWERVGFNDLVLDPDGVVRRSFLFVPGQEDGYYAFSLRLVLGYLKRDLSLNLFPPTGASSLELAPQRDSSLADRPDPPTHPHISPLFNFLPGQALKIADHILPRLQPQSGGYDQLDSRGYQILLDYHSPDGGIPQVSLAEVIANQVDPELIHDRIVLIGTTASSLKDSFRTPYSSGPISGQTNGQTESFLMPGVVIHGQIVSHLLEVVLADRPLLSYWSPGWEWAWVTLWIGLGASVGWWVRRPLVGSAITATVIVVPVGLTYGLFLGHIWVPLVTPLLGMGLAATATVGYRAYQFQQQQQIVMRLLGQSTSPEIAQALWNDREQLLKSGKLPGQRLTATMMFADIRNFSTTAESMTPEALMDWLNDCLDPVTEEIQRHHGIVNKFTGDGFMAVFGLPMARVPAEIIQDAKNAVACALAIARRLRTLNHHWQAQHKPLMQMRVGIFTGPVTAGSLGGKERMEYGIIGDSVNIASRLESCAKDRHVGTCRILIGQDTYDCLEDEFTVEDWGPMALKGKQQMVNVYRVLDLEDPGELATLQPPKEFVDRVAT
jgi:CHASE2 domain-containing sensor protein/class 3 adenylate cyclase